MRGFLTREDTITIQQSFLSWIDWIVWFCDDICMIIVKYIEFIKYNKDKTTTVIVDFQSYINICVCKFSTRFKPSEEINNRWEYYSICFLILFYACSWLHLFIALYWMLENQDLALCSQRMGPFVAYCINVIH